MALWGPRNHAAVRQTVGEHDAVNTCQNIRKKQRIASHANGREADKKACGSAWQDVAKPATRYTTAIAKPASPGPTPVMGCSRQLSLYSCVLQNALQGC